MGLIMVSPRDLETFLRDAVPALATAADVPGVAVAVAHGATTVATFSGLTRAGGRPIDRHSIFEIGSITKIWTATLALQLVDEGILSLDSPVVSILPTFRLADPDVSRTITVRHLLMHSTGFDGDIFLDTGEDDESVRRYVDALSEVQPYSQPGSLFSYCNAGIVILGRVIEVLREMPFDTALTRHLVSPLGLTTVFTDPHRAPADLLVIGHSQPAAKPVPVGSMPRGMAPTGTRLSMTAFDLLEFGRLHTGIGRQAGNSPLLSRAALDAMRTVQKVSVPYLGPHYGAARGLGWSIDEIEGCQVLGHNGHTAGQIAALRVVPDHELVVVVLTNGGDAYTLIDDVVATALFDTVGLASPPPVRPPRVGESIDSSVYEGTYQGYGVRQVVSSGSGDALRLSTSHADSPGVFGNADMKADLQHVGEDSFISREADCGYHPVFTFVRGDDGAIAYMHSGRAIPRVGERTEV